VATHGVNGMRVVAPRVAKVVPLVIAAIRFAKAMKHPQAVPAIVVAQQVVLPRLLITTRQDPRPVTAPPVREGVTMIPRVVPPRAGRRATPV